jgi:hypothetical protein
LNRDSNPGYPANIPHEVVRNQCAKVPLRSPRTCRGSRRSAGKGLPVATVNRTDCGFRAASWARPGTTTRRSDLAEFLRSQMRGILATELFRRALLAA